MLIPYTKIVGLNVVELRTQSKIGLVSDLIIQKDGFKISGLALQKKFLEKSPLIIAALDIVDISQEVVIANDAEAVTPLADNIRMKESYSSGYHGIHQHVETESGKKIGIVYDFLIDSTTFDIAKFYVRTLLSERIIPITSVVDLEGKKLIIKDGFENVRVPSPVVESSLV